jgi:O-antigen/teichoic acid export membrane protein
VSTRAIMVGSARRPRARLLEALRNPLYRSGYAMIINTVATTAVGVIYWAIAARLYSSQTLGRSSALISALLLISSFAQLNFTDTLPRFMPLAGRSMSKFIGYSYFLSGIAALLISGGFVIILPRMSSQWHFLGDSNLLCVAFVVAAVIWGVFALQDFVLLSLRQSMIVPAENLVYGVIKLLLLAGVAWVMPSSGIFFSWIVPLGITVPGVNWLIFRQYIRKHESALAPSKLHIGEMARYASIDYVGTTLSQAYGNLLPLVVLSTLGPAANGVFYIAWTIASGLGLLAANLSVSLLVEASNAPHRLAELTRGVLTRCVALTAFGAIVIAAAAHPILLLYGSAYAVHASTLLRLLSLGTIPYCVTVVALSLDRVERRVGRASLTRLALTILVLGGSWVLVRRVGVDGVAYAWGGANILVALVRFPTVAFAMRRQRTARPPVYLPSAGRVGGRRRHRGRHRRVSENRLGLAAMTLTEVESSGSKAADRGSIRSVRGAR